LTTNQSSIEETLSTFKTFTGATAASKNEKYFSYTKITWSENSKWSHSIHLKHQSPVLKNTS
jgi:hypothetical protein